MGEPTAPALATLRLFFIAPGTHSKMHLGRAKAEMNRAVWIAIRIRGLSIAATAECLSAPEEMETNGPEHEYALAFARRRAL